MALVACSSIETKPADPVVHNAGKVLRAKGYADLGRLAHLTDAQNQIVAEQNAKINAYRELARQLYKENLASNLVVADQVIKEESFRVYLDLFLREARLVDSKLNANQKRVVLTLVLTPRFYHCISSTVARVESCLREDDKVQFTRIGYQRALESTVNLSCSDCSSQLSVSGFSKEKSALDKALLDVGMYDSQWGGNMAVTTAIRYLYFSRFF
jgi:hypothetical protein